MNLRTIAIGVLAIGLYAGSVFAADYSAYTIDVECNENKGKVLYRANCRTACHIGTDTAKAMSPMDKMQSEWEKLAANLSEIPCIKDWPQGLSEDDMNDIFSYLYGGASDSPTPVS